MIAVVAAVLLTLVPVALALHTLSMLMRVGAIDVH